MTASPAFADEPDPTPPDAAAVEPSADPPTDPPAVPLADPPVIEEDPPVVEEDPPVDPVVPDDAVAQQDAAPPADDITILALPATASDTAAIAWVGNVPEPATKITLAAALLAGGQVNLVPSASGYLFNILLTVSTTTTLVAASDTPLYGAMRLTGGGGLTFSGISLAPRVNSATLVTVAVANVTLTNLRLANPGESTGVTGINAGTFAGLTISAPTIDGIATGINLATSAGAVITTPTITPPVAAVVSTGITTASTGIGPQITGGSIQFNAGGTGISLGATTGALVSGTVLTGIGGTGVGVNTATASGAVITGVTITGTSTGINSTASATGGFELRNSSVSSSTVGVTLATRVGVVISGVTITGQNVGGSTYGIYNNSAQSTSITGTTVSGFGTGIGTVQANTGVGPTITGGQVTGSQYGITLGSTTGASISGTRVVGTFTTGTTIGVYVNLASDVSISEADLSGYSTLIMAVSANSSTGILITDCTFHLWQPAAPPVIGAFGINLGAMKGAVITRPIIEGTATGAGIGIALGRAPAAQVIDALMTNLAGGIQEGRLTLGVKIEGPTITNPRITASGGGIYLASSTGAVITNAVLDTGGDAISGHELENVTITSPHITGHPGPIANPLKGGTNAIRFYYTTGVTVTDPVITGGSTAFYWDMSYDVLVERATVSGTVWWANYTESVTGYVLRDSTFTGNYAIGNLTINPSLQPPLDNIQVSADVLFEHNTFRNNPKGLYLPLGARGITFTDNVVSGVAEYVILATPVHILDVTNNEISFIPASATAAAIWVNTFYEDQLFAGSQSSSGISVTGNVFAGPGPFLRVGTPPLVIEDLVALGDPRPASAELPGAQEPPEPPLEGAPPPEPEVLDAESIPDEAPAPAQFDLAFDGVLTTLAEPAAASPAASAMAPGALAAVPPEDARALSQTILVSNNVFPQNSTAIVTHPNAEVGVDTNTNNLLIDGDVAVDAREETLPAQNDWGSPCGPRVAATGYDGGGAFVIEGLTTQVLYPEGCSTGPVPASDGTIASTGWDGIGGLLLAILAILSGSVVLEVDRRRRLAQNARLR